MAVCFGLGSMGMAISRRLRECGHRVVAWNRSEAKSAALAAEDFPGSCLAAPSPIAALDAAGSTDLVIVCLSDTSVVERLLMEPGMHAYLEGKVVANLTSGSPDDGRSVGRLLKANVPSLGGYIDGAICGAPAKARVGQAQLFLSSEDERTLEPHRELLSSLGRVTFSPGIGASRALDYAVVDLAFVNALSFLSNAPLLEREGVDPAQVLEQMKQRLETVPGFLEHCQASIEAQHSERSEDQYRKNVTASLGTWRNFWASRLPYLEQNKINSDLPRFAIAMLDKAIGDQGQHAAADVTRLQEVMFDRAQ